MSYQLIPVSGRIDEALHVTPVACNGRRGRYPPPWYELRAAFSGFEYENQALGRELESENISGTWLTAALYNGQRRDRTVYPVLPDDVEPASHYWDVWIPLHEIAVYDDQRNRSYPLHYDRVKLYQVGTGLNPNAPQGATAFQRPYMAVAAGSQEERVIQRFMHQRRNVASDVRWVDKFDVREELHYRHDLQSWMVPYNHSSWNGQRSYPQIYVPNNIPIWEDYKWERIFRMRFDRAQGRYV